MYNIPKLSPFLSLSKSLLPLIVSLHYPPSFYLQQKLESLLYIIINDFCGSYIVLFIYNIQMIICSMYSLIHSSKLLRHLSPYPIIHLSTLLIYPSISFILSIYLFIIHQLIIFLSIYLSIYLSILSINLIYISLYLGLGVHDRPITGGAWTQRGRPG